MEQEGLVLYKLRRLMQRDASAPVLEIADDSFYHWQAGLTEKTRYFEAGCSLTTFSHAMHSVTRVLFRDLKLHMRLSLREVIGMINHDEGAIDSESVFVSVSIGSTPLVTTTLAFALIQQHSPVESNFMSRCHELFRVFCRRRLSSLCANKIVSEMLSLEERAERLVHVPNTGLVDKQKKRDFAFDLKLTKPLYLPKPVYQSIFFQVTLKTDVLAQSDIYLSAQVSLDPGAHSIVDTTSQLIDATDGEEHPLRSIIDATDGETPYSRFERMPVTREFGSRHLQFDATLMFSHGVAPTVSLGFILNINAKSTNIDRCRFNFGDESTVLHVRRVACIGDSCWLTATFSPFVSLNDFVSGKLWPGLLEAGSTINLGRIGGTMLLEFSNSNDEPLAFDKPHPCFKAMLYCHQYNVFFEQNGVAGLRFN